VGIFRKKETLNEQMLREAGLDRVVLNTPLPASKPVAGDPPQFEFGRRASRLNHEPLAWDATTTATAPGLQGDYVAFITLPGGDLIVISGDGDGDLSPLADSIEEHVSPPYRAAASRQDDDRWGVGAVRIEVATISFQGADELDLAQSGGVSELDVDGEPSDATPPLELQRLGERIGGDFCVEANRIDGDYWEVKVSSL